MSLSTERRLNPVSMRRPRRDRPAVGKTASARGGRRKGKRWKEEGCDLRDQNVGLRAAPRMRTIGPKMKTDYILFAACVALASGCTSARSERAGKTNRSEQDSVCMLQDDFEGDQPPFLRHVGESLKLTIVSGNEALSGKRSLCMDSMGSSHEWIIGAQLSKGLRLIPGKGYAVEFKYLLTDTANPSRLRTFSRSRGPKVISTHAPRSRRLPDKRAKPPSRLSCPMTRRTLSSGFLRTARAAC